MKLAAAALALAVLTGCVGAAVVPDNTTTARAATPGGPAAPAAVTPTAAAALPVVPVEPMLVDKKPVNASAAPAAAAVPAAPTVEKMAPMVVPPGNSSIRMQVVGESCKENGDCRVPNTYCKANSCHCSAGFVFSDDAKRCLPVATQADPSCEEARQCVILLRSAAGPSGAAVCLEGKCRCRYDHEFNNGTCVLKKARGMACSNDVECEDLVDGACIQGVCGCATGTVPAVAANKCLPVLRSLGAPCVEQIQCSEGLGDLGLCRGGACACADGARLGADNKCECEAGRAEDKTRCERPPMHASVAKVAQRQEGGKGGAAATPFSSVLTIIAVVSASLWTLSSGL